MHLFNGERKRDFQSSGVELFAVNCEAKVSVQSVHPCDKGIEIHDEGVAVVNVAAVHQWFEGKRLHNGCCVLERERCIKLVLLC
jgi:hypothetical protein